MPCRHLNVLNALFNLFSPPHSSGEQQGGAGDLYYHWPPRVERNEIFFEQNYLAPLVLLDPSVSTFLVGLRLSLMLPNSVRTVSRQISSTYTPPNFSVAKVICRHRYTQIPTGPTPPCGNKVVLVASLVTSAIEMTLKTASTHRRATSPRRLCKVDLQKYTA